MCFLAGELSDNVTFLYQLKMAVCKYWSVNTWNGMACSQKLGINSRGVAQFWVVALECELANCAVRREDLQLALSILEETMDTHFKWEKSCEDKQKLELNTAIPISPFSLCGFLSHTVKILLKFGNVEKAKSINEIARARFQQNVLSQPQLLLNDGLIFFAESQYVKAAQSFKDALQVNRGGSKEASMATLLEKRALSISAANNYAIACLFTCELQSAVACLEDFVREDPFCHMVDEIVFNLATLYELSCDQENCERKRKILRCVAEQFKVRRIGKVHGQIDGQVAFRV